MIGLRERTPGADSQRASFGLPSKRQISRPDAASYARSQPSPPPKSTCVRPPTSAATGLHHCPCSTCSPAPTARQTTLPRTLVHRDEARRARRGDARVSFVAAVGGADDQQVADRQHVAVRRFVRKDAEARTCPVPRRCRRGRPGRLADTGRRFARGTPRVQAAKLAFGGDVVQAVSFDVRRTGRRRQQELAQPALHARRQVLPEERAVRRAKRHEHAALFGEGGIQLPRVVGADVDHSPATTGRPSVSSPSSTLQAMFRPVLVSQSTGGLPLGPVVWRCGATRRRRHQRRGVRRFRRAAGDSIQRPLGFGVQRGSFAASLSASRAAGLWPDAAERPSGADAHVEVIVLQRLDQPRHRRRGRRTDARQRLARPPANAGNGSPSALTKSIVAGAAAGPIDANASAA